MAYVDVEGPRFDTRLIIGKHDRVIPGDLLPANCKALFVEYPTSDSANVPAMVTGQVPNIWGTDQHRDLRLAAAYKDLPIVAAEPTYTPEGNRQMRATYHKKPFGIFDLLGQKNREKLLVACAEIADSDREIAYEGEEYKMIVRGLNEHIKKVPAVGLFTSLRNCLIAERVYRFTDVWLKTHEDLSAKKPSVAISAGLFHIEVAKALKQSQEERISFLDSQRQALDGLVEQASISDVVFALRQTDLNGGSYFQVFEIPLQGN